MRSVELWKGVFVVSELVILSSRVIYKMGAIIESSGFKKKKTLAAKNLIQFWKGAVVPSIIQQPTAFLEVVEIGEGCFCPNE